MLFLIQTDDINEHLSKFDRIKFEHEFLLYYQELFDDCNVDDIETLMLQKNKSVATQAAWKRIIRATRKTKDQFIVRPNQKQLSWFLGFMEGRNNIVVPRPWKNLVLSSASDAPTDQQKFQPYHHANMKRVGCPKNAAIERVKQGISYVTSKDSIVIPDELIEAARKVGHWNSICGVFTKDKFFVAIHGDVGATHLVASINRKSNEIDWISQACGCCFGPTTGYHESWVTLEPTNDGKLYCFGAASIGFYVHGFDINSGQTIFRFTNNF